MSRWHSLHPVQPRCKALCHSRGETYRARIVFKANMEGTGILMPSQREKGHTEWDHATEAAYIGIHLLNPADELVTSVNINTSCPVAQGF